MNRMTLIIATLAILCVAGAVAASEQGGATTVASAPYVTSVVEVKARAAASGQHALIAFKSPT
ncbi:MAG TPA: hypothetical protein VN285_05565 [Candidatus Deferrimicrobium sp.]|nr:hypothetical protein [Candidatus Deferrimicrobium sp.]